MKQRKSQQELLPASPPDALVTRRSRTDEELAEENKKLDWNVIRRLWPYAKPYRKSLIWLTFHTVCRAIQLPLLAWTIGAIINGPVAQKNETGILWGVIGFGLLAALTGITLHFRTRMALEFGEQVVHDIRRDAFRHLQTLTLSFFQKMKLGSLISRLTADIEGIRQGVQEVFFTGLVYAGQMLVASVLMIMLDWKMFCLLLIVLPPIAILNRIFHRVIGAAYRAQSENYSYITANLVESVNGIRLIQGYGREERNNAFFRILAMWQARANLRSTTISARFYPSIEFLSFALMGVMIMFGGWRAMDPDSHVTEGHIIQFLLLCGLLFEPVYLFSGLYNLALGAVIGGERVFKLLDTKPIWQDAPESTPLEECSGGVRFENVTFSYVSGNPVLKDVSFMIPPGTRVALVGHTGSGKTTITALLSKYFIPDTGEIYLDEKRLSETTSASLRHWIASVPQQNFLFTGTVRENLRMGKPDATDEDLNRVIEKLDLQHVIEALPEGMETLVGEKGAKLSAGQRQLLCFARAMLAEPSILILDEATSSIDSLTEARLQKAMDTLLLGRTSFVIAHRLSTIVHSDVILVLKDGRLIEQGNHETLLKLEGEYAKLHREFTMASH